MPDPLVLVVTINYNQNGYTEECVASLLRSSYTNFKVVVVDNGSSKDHYECLLHALPEDGRLSIERLEENRGYVGGVNFGLEMGSELRPDYFLVLNNDTLIDESAIASLVECAERRGRRAIVSGKVYNYDEKDMLQYIGQDFDPKGMLDQRSIVKGGRERDVGQYDVEREMGMLDDIYWLLPFNLYKEIGPYSEYFYLYGEQNDYGIRASRAGYKLVYTPNAKLWHKGGVTTCNGEKTSAKIEYWTCFAVFKLAVLHFPRSKSNPFIRKWFVRKLLKSLFLYVSGEIKFDNVKSIVLAYRHFRHWDKVRYKDNGYNPFF